MVGVAECVMWAKPYTRARHENSPVARASSLQGGSPAWGCSAQTLPAFRRNLRQSRKISFKNSSAKRNIFAKKEKKEKKEK